MTLIPTILCGGAGSRLWPLSRECEPKPFICLSDGQNLLQKSYIRGSSIRGVENMLTITNRDFFFRTQDNISELVDFDQPLKNHYILEPFAKNTAPAIALSCLYANRYISKESILLILAADHLILDQNAFEEAIFHAYEFAKEDKIATFGIKPNYPETGYGYIEFSQSDVVRFVEKPDFQTAQHYIESKSFLWNSGMFCFKASVMLNEIQKHNKYLFDRVNESFDNGVYSSSEFFSQLNISPVDFENVPSDSIDYAVMEKTKNAKVVQCDIGWSDIGCWHAFGSLIPEDKYKNRIQGDVIVQDSKNCTIISPDRMVGVVGVENLIVVDTPDALLVANESAAQDVKMVFNTLKMNDHTTYKTHIKSYRPWGSFTILSESKNFKVKRIEVKPGARLSLQMHHHRSEHWVVIEGIAKVIRGDQEIILNENESTYIPVSYRHRLENIGQDPLIIIEIQTGTYLGEDDIVRFEDNYDRVEKGKIKNEK